MKTLDVLTEMVCSLDSDLIGIAWMIARRSPHLTIGQIERAARIELKRETFGTLGRKARKTVTRQRETFNECRHNRVDDRGHDVEQLDTLTTYGEQLAAELGELGGLLADGWQVKEAAELCEVSRETAFRRLRTIRDRHSAEFSKLLAE